MLFITIYDLSMSMCTISSRNNASNFNLSNFSGGKVKIFGAYSIFERLLLKIPSSSQKVKFVESNNISFDFRVGNIKTNTCRYIDT